MYADRIHTISLSPDGTMRGKGYGYSIPFAGWKMSGLKEINSQFMQAFTDAPKAFQVTRKGTEATWESVGSASGILIIRTSQYQPVMTLILSGQELDDGVEASRAFVQRLIEVVPGTSVKTQDVLAYDKRPLTVTVSVESDAWHNMGTMLALDAVATIFLSRAGVIRPIPPEEPLHEQGLVRRVLIDLSGKIRGIANQKVYDIIGKGKVLEPISKPIVEHGNYFLQKIHRNLLQFEDRVTVEGRNFAIRYVSVGAGAAMLEVAEGERVIATNFYTIREAGPEAFVDFRKTVEHEYPEIEIATTSELLQAMRQPLWASIAGEDLEQVPAVQIVLRAAALGFFLHCQHSLGV